MTHDLHPDNLDRQGRELLSRVGTGLTTEDGAGRLKNGSRGLRPWDSVTVETPQGSRIRITATPARHGPPFIEKLVGEVIGFVVSREETGEDLFYVTGDTV